MKSAEALFINPRTVSGTVTNLLAKLGVESRTAATSPPEAEVLGLTPITLLKEAGRRGGWTAGFSRLISLSAGS
jgi:hypothetical protein